MIDLLTLGGSLCAVNRKQSETWCYWKEKQVKISRYTHSDIRRKGLIFGKYLLWTLILTSRFEIEDILVLSSNLSYNSRRFSAIEYFFGERSTINTNFKISKNEPNNITVLKDLAALNQTKVVFIFIALLDCHDLDWKWGDLNIRLVFISSNLNSLPLVILYFLGRSESVRR